MTDYIFSIDYNEKTKEDKFYSHRFFKKIISKEDFFCFQREMIRKRQEYQLVPYLKNGTLDVITYFKQKASLARLNNWNSDFGKRVKVKCEFIEDNSYKEAINATKVKELPRSLFLKVWILNEQTNKNIFEDNFYFNLRIVYSFENYEYWNYSAEYIALLIRNAINGNLQTARDIEETILKRIEDVYMEEGRDIFECDICDKKFKNLNELFSHLIEENHYDSFLDEFPNDNEVQRIKNVIKKGLA